MESFLSTIWELIYLYLIALWSIYIQIIQGHRPLKERELERKDGKVVIVTGGAIGIGLETSKWLCKLGMHVIIGTRFDHEAEAGFKAIRKESPDAKLDYIPLDLSSLKSVRQFAESFKKKNLPLHVLLNNAGVMLTPENAKTEDGYDMQLGVNHLGHFLLTNLLLDKLQKTGKSGETARIVWVASSAHYAGHIIDGYFKKQKFAYYSPHFCYGQSKLANVLCAKHLQRQLTQAGSHVTINCVHPGMVRSDLYQNVSAVVNVLQSPLYSWGGFWNTTQGCSSSVYCATSPAMEETRGAFIFNCRDLESSKLTYDVDLQVKTWDLSCDAVGVLHDWKI